MIPITKPYFNNEEIENLKKCLDSGWVTEGPMAAEFEKRFLAVHPSKYALSVSSCTAALHIATSALGLGPGDEVIVPAFTWITSASCAEYVGADVKFADVEKETFNIDPDKIECAITPNTKAIIAVHLFGRCADMDKINKIAKKHNLYVIEDCACAIGSEYKGKKAGTMGDIGCFSFHPRKAVTTGEGGMCSTDNENLYNKMLQLKNHGKSYVVKSPDNSQPYYMGCYDDLGYNLRLSDIQAAVGLAQFNKLDTLLTDRRKSAEYYRTILADISGLILPEDPGGHTYQSFVILIESGDRELRNRVMLKLRDNDIQTRPGTIAISRTAYNMKKYGLNPGDFPIAEFCEDTSITLPLYPFMPRDEQDFIADIIKTELNKTVTI